MTTAEMDGEALESLRQSLFQKFWRKLRQEFEKMERGNTRKFDKVLAQWLALEQAVQFSPTKNLSESTDLRVQAALEKLTAPENVRSLENLFYQLSDPRQIELAAEALKKCRERVSNGTRVTDVTRRTEEK